MLVKLSISGNLIANTLTNAIKNKTSKERLLAFIAKVNNYGAYQARGLYDKVVSTPMPHIDSASTSISNTGKVTLNQNYLNKLNNIFGTQVPSVKITGSSDPTTAYSTIGGPGTITAPTHFPVIAHEFGHKATDRFSPRYLAAIQARHLNADKFSETPRANLFFERLANRAAARVLNKLTPEQLAELGLHYPQPNQHGAAMTHKDILEPMTLGLQAYQLNQLGEFLQHLHTGESTYGQLGFSAPYRRALQSWQNYSNK